MAYMLLIVEPQGQRGTRAPQEGDDLYRRMLDYGPAAQWATIEVRWIGPRYE